MIALPCTIIICSLQKKQTAIRAIRGTLLTQSFYRRNVWKIKFFQRDFLSML